jgi:outer membrane lipoprotein
MQLVDLRALKFNFLKGLLLKNESFYMDQKILLMDPDGLVRDSMIFLKTIFSVTVLLMSTVSCSVISQQLKDESLPPTPFGELLQNIDEYTGETVILGGYVLEIENITDETIIRVLQAPLSFGDEPDSRDKTEGRFIVSYKGFLDPEVYSKNRRITVAGIIIGLQTEEIGSCPYACLKIESREIHIWPEYEYRDYFLYDDPFYYSPYSYPYRRYPYYLHSPSYSPYWWY